MSQMPEFEHIKSEQTAITSGTRFEVCFKNRTKTFSRNKCKATLH